MSVYLFAFKDVQNCCGVAEYTRAYTPKTVHNIANFDKVFNVIKTRREITKHD